MHNALGSVSSTHLQKSKKQKADGAIFHLWYKQKTTISYSLSVLSEQPDKYKLTGEVGYMHAWGIFSQLIYQKWGNSRFSQRPCIKNTVGGLQDSSTGKAVPLNFINPRLNPRNDGRREPTPSRSNHPQEGREGGREGEC